MIFPRRRRRAAASGGTDGKSEILFLPPKDTAKEKWNGVRMSPTDPGIEARTGFASVQPISELDLDAPENRDGVSANLHDPAV